MKQLKNTDTMKRLSIYRNLIIAALFLLGTGVSFSQTQNIDWSAQSPYLAINGTSIVTASNLTKQGNVMVWQQVGTNVTDTDMFTVTSASGNWDSQTHQGVLSYALAHESGNQAEMTITGNSSGVTMTLNIQSDTYVFEIEEETLTNL